MRFNWILFLVLIASIAVSISMIICCPLLFAIIAALSVAYILLAMAIDDSLPETGHWEDKND